MAVPVVLLIAFLGSLGMNFLISGDIRPIFSANIAMCLMLFFTALGHFKFAKGMEMMIPPFIPFKRAVVLLTGIMEIVAGIALLFPEYRHVTGIFLIMFFVLLLPANVYAASQNLDYQKGTFDGKGLSYLWFRVPLQVFLIAWVWYFSVYRG